MAPIAISQQVAKHFVQKAGSIVTISSNSARMPRMQLGMYATTKAALSHFVAIWHLKSPLIKSG